MGAGTIQPVITKFTQARTKADKLEAYVLDTPCLVHRKAVEQPAGVGENVVVSGLRIDALRAFLAEPQAHRRRAAPPDVTPSDVIVQDLQRRGFVP